MMSPSQETVLPAVELMPDRMSLRILHVISSMNPNLGGIVECVRQIGRSLSARGDTIEVAICQDVPGAPWLASIPIRCHPLGPGVGKYAYSPRLRRWLKEYGKTYDAWVINGLWQFQGLGASRVALDLGIPYFVYAHGMLDPWSRRAHPFKYLKKLAYWLLAEGATLERAQGVIFTSQEESELAQHFFPKAGWKSIVVGNGISLPSGVARRQPEIFKQIHNVDKEREVWLFLGRLDPKKGIELLLKAFSSKLISTQNVILVIAGGGETSYVRNLQRKSRNLGIEDRVRWLGPLYGEEKWEAFSSAALFILPSHQENFGIALVEAMAMGVPVCTTRSVNIHREIEAFNAGIICEDNEKSLVDAFQRWQRLSEGDRTRAGRDARHCFEVNFQIEGAANRLRQAICNALAC
jgi:glycosyltransferase involved in cell wall biosynthesis